MGRAGLIKRRHHTAKRTIPSNNEQPSNSESNSIDDVPNSSDMNEVPASFSINVLDDIKKEKPDDQV